MTPEFIKYKADIFNVPFGWAVASRRNYLLDKISILKKQIKVSNNVNIEETIIGKKLAQEYLFKLISEKSLYEKELLKLDNINFSKLDKFQQMDLKPILDIPIEIILGKPNSRQGNRLWYLSPLRDDGKKASFCVSIDKNLWFDFVLGEGGNIIDLYMKINNSNFITTIKELQKFT